MKPKDPKRTKEPGYMTNTDNIELDESINITRGLKTRDELGAKVILDLTSKTVVKNSFNESRDFVTLLAHYQDGYSKYINPLIAQLFKDELNEPVDVSGEKEKESSGS